MFLSLIEGIGESPPWTSFIRDLAARTQARQGVLLIRLANSPAGEDPIVVEAAAPRTGAGLEFDIRQFTELRLNPFGALRPGRVYAADELLDFDDQALLALQRPSLHSMGIRYGRWLRVSAGGIADAWILITRDREDFSSDAAAALSAVGSLLAVALRARASLNQERMQAKLAQSALRNLGIGQVVFDAAGRVIAADSLAEAQLTFIEGPDGASGQRLQVPVGVEADIEAACFDAAQGGATTLIKLDDAGSLLVKPCDLALPGGCTRPAAIGVIRLECREDERCGASCSARSTTFPLAKPRWQKSSAAGSALSRLAGTFS